MVQRSAATRWTALSGQRHSNDSGADRRARCSAQLTENADELGTDPRRIAIQGASAGASLCAALALLARDRGGPHIAFQFLAVPELDDRLTTPSMTTFTDTPMWDRPNAVASGEHYLGPGRAGTEAVSIYAPPARATDLAGLPSAYVSVMHFDPLPSGGPVAVSPTPLRRTARSVHSG